MESGSAHLVGRSGTVKLDDAGEAFPGYQSQTLKTFGNTPYTKSPVTAFNEFSESLRSFLPKELAFQGVDDVIRSGGISIPVELFDAHYFDRMRK